MGTPQPLGRPVASVLNYAAGGAPIGNAVLPAALDHPMSRISAVHVAAAAMLAGALHLWSSAPLAAQAPAAGALPAGPGSLDGVWPKAGYRNLELASLQTPDREKVQHTSEGGCPPFQPRANADVEERIRRSDDPRTFTRLWNATQVFRAAPAGTTLTEYICENNRDDPATR